MHHSLTVTSSTFNRRCIIFFQCMGKKGRKEMLSTFRNSSWERGRVNLIFPPDLAGDVN